MRALLLLGCLGSVACSAGSGAGAHGTQSDAGFEAAGGGSAGVSGSGGSASGTSDADAGVWNAAKAAQQWAEQFCSSAESCCTALGTTFENCVTVWTSPPSVSKFEKYFASPDIAFDETKWTACLALLESHSGNCDQLEYLSSADVCGFGTIPTGGQCGLVSVGCAAPLGSMPECEVLKCSYYSRGKAGDPCQSTCDLGSCQEAVDAEHGAKCHLEDGLFCDPGTLTCKPLLAAGETSCMPVSCTKDAYCQPVGECALKKPIGSTCYTHEECLQGFCLGATPAGACVPAKALGEKCYADYECAHRCFWQSSEGGVCAGPAKSDFWNSWCGFSL